MTVFLWEDASSGSIIGKDQALSCFYPFGTYTVSLTITDDAFETASTSQTIVVAPESKVPGTLCTVNCLACIVHPVSYRLSSRDYVCSDLLAGYLFCTACCSTNMRSIVNVLNVGKCMAQCGTHRANS